MQWICVTVLLLLVAGTACSQDFSEYLQTLKEKIGDLLPAEKVQNDVRNKCENTGGLEAFDKLKTAVNELQEFLISNFNITQIREELDMARPAVEFNIVFKKYCDRIPIVHRYVRNISMAAESCLEEEEKYILELLLNITNAVTDAVCYNEGDRLAMFVEEGGPECLLSQKENLERCANESLSDLIPENFSDNDLLLVDSNEAQKCTNFVKLRTCVMTSLDDCDDGIPSILVGGLFNLIRRLSPCLKYPTS